VIMSTEDLSTHERLMRIETALAHVQHDIEDLNKSLTEHFRRLQSFETRFTRIEHEIVTLAEGPEGRDAEAERPPHY